MTTLDNIEDCSYTDCKSSDTILEDDDYQKRPDGIYLVRRVSCNVCGKITTIEFKLTAKVIQVEEI